MIQISRTSFILPIYLIKMKLLYSFYLDGNAPTQPLGHPPIYMLYATLTQNRLLCDPNHISTLGIVISLISV